jgi:hypothetical protein
MRGVKKLGVAEIPQLPALPETTGSPLPALLAASNGLNPLTNSQHYQLGYRLVVRVLAPASDHLPLVALA